MAEERTATGVLVMLMDHDQVGGTPAKTAMRYKRGDIVAVYPPGKRYWYPPSEPWLFVEITGQLPLTFDQIKARYEQMERQLAFLPDGTERMLGIARRVFQVNLAALPAAVQTVLATDRYATMTWQQVKGYVRNKVTNETEG